jgi:membrane protease YdiL (CAAX protease family)
MSVPPNPLPEGVQELSPAAAVPEQGRPGPIVEIIAPQPPPPKPFPAWSGWDVLAILVFTSFSVIVSIVIALLASGVVTGHANVSVTELTSNPRVIRAFLAGQAGAYLVVLLAMFVLVRSRARRPFGQGIEWNWPGASAAMFFVSGIVLALAIDGLSRFLPMPKSLPIEDLFNNRTNAYLMAVFGVSLAPLLEELFFRGLLYPVLRRGLGFVTAVLLTAVGFAGIHSVQLGYAWAPILSIFVVGVVFTLVRQRWSSVGASFLMHCGYNFTLFTLLWLTSDHFRHLEKAAG